jgi:hypothetical protein
MLLLTYTSSADAYVVLTAPDNTNAIGILNLEISGTAYDVDFTQITITDGLGPASGDVFAGPVEDIVANQAAATAAVAAINAALDATGTVKTAGSVLNNIYSVPYLFDDQRSIGQGGCGYLCTMDGDSLFIAGTWGTPVNGAYDIDDQIYVARFTTPATVPLPPAAFLFVSGLAILGWVRRRQKEVR